MTEAPSPDRSRDPRRRWAPPGRAPRRLAAAALATATLCDLPGPGDAATLRAAYTGPDPSGAGLSFAIDFLDRNEDSFFEIGEMTGFSGFAIEGITYGILVQVPTVPGLATGNTTSTFWLFESATVPFASIAVPWQSWSYSLALDRSLPGPGGPRTPIPGAVPLPATLPLAAAALVVLPGLGRRRRRPG
ncbi:hypothetical protein [Frigidibacter sp. MR17.24]|uniref:hypothetical protein n=1 Tax=Frigidibacter sp. MR17.24 TaxID=3127345 RepID=UPI003012E24F